MYKVVEKCRICGNPDLVPVLDLGNQALSAIFPTADAPDPGRSPLELVLCSGPEDSDVCRLLQLKHSASVGEMYGLTYGYRSSTSPMMRSHLKAKVDQLLELVKPVPGDIVLDIGCNDGTLLNFYRDRGLVRIGMDPSSAKFASNFDSDIRVIHDFFAASGVRSLVGDAKCRIVTSIAMFYDLDDPQAFVDDIKQVLAPDGIWAFELSYLPLMFTNLTYDQVCHEHVTYLALSQIERLLKKAGLRILDVSFNEVNGGSFHILACHDDGPYASETAKLQAILAAEEPLKGFAPYERFQDRVNAHRDDVRNFLALAKAAGKTVYGYGASTKGNITLNFCDATPDDMVAICDAQEQKYGLVTPGVRIPIVSKAEARAAQPDYMLVLIWHFRKEIIEDEMEYLRKGGKLVFALPRMHIVDKDNYERYLNAPFADIGFTL